MTTYGYTSAQPELTRDQMVEILTRQDWDPDEIREMDDEDLRTELLPPLQGALGRFRVYDRDHCFYDSFPSSKDGGPAMVTIDGWCSSYTTQIGVPGAKTQVLVYRPSGFGLYQEHKLNGTEYDTMDAARRATFDAGLIGFMVYEPEEGQ